MRAAIQRKHVFQCNSNVQIKNIYQLHVKDERAKWEIKS